MSSIVRAKFRCVATNKSDYGAGPQDTVILQPVTSGQGNESWSKWTPAGKLEMTITNPEAVAKFELGKSYFLDFTPADEG